MAEIRQWQETPTGEQVQIRYPILQFFKYTHLPLPLQSTSEPYCRLAWELAYINPWGSQEVSAGLRKLLEAKDCAVRAALEARESAEKGASRG